MPAVHSPPPLCHNQSRCESFTIGFALSDSDSDSDSDPFISTGLQKKYNYLSELRSCEKRVEEGGKEETAGGRWGGSGRRVKSYNER